LGSPADPACASDPGAVRATIQTISAWLLLQPRGPVRTAEPMTARVRWSPQRVCLEAVELPDRSVDMIEGIQLDAWIVARFVPQPAAARVAIQPGAEMRQGISCAFAKP
jgi:hypothetical protein